MGFGMISFFKTLLKISNNSKKTKNDHISRIFVIKLEVFKCFISFMFLELDLY